MQPTQIFFRTFCAPERSLRPDLFCTTPVMAMIITCCGQPRRTRALFSLWTKSSSMPTTVALGDTVRALCLRVCTLAVLFLVLVAATPAARTEAADSGTSILMRIRVDPLRFPRARCNDASDYFFYQVCCWSQWVVHTRAASGLAVLRQACVTQWQWSQETHQIVCFVCLILLHVSSSPIECLT